MKDQRERLTNLILNAPKLEFKSGSRAQGKTYQTAQNIADHLLANGVIVPPCKVGDIVFDISSGEVLNCTVEKIEILLNERMSIYIDISIKYPTYSATETIETDYFGKTVFLTKVEAEKALKEKEK